MEKSFVENIINELYENLMFDVIEEDKVIW
jgi:hypothetical protein